MQNLFSLLLFFSGSQADWGQSPASRSQRVKLEDLGLRGVAKCSPSLHWPKRLQLTLQGKDPVVIDVQSESQEMGTYFSCRKKRYRAVCSKTHWLPQFRLAKSLRSVAWCYLRSLVCGFSWEEHTEATQSTGFLCPLKTKKKRGLKLCRLLWAHSLLSAFSPPQVIVSRIDTGSDVSSPASTSCSSPWASDFSCKMEMMLPILSGFCEKQMDIKCFVN